MEVNFVTKEKIKMAKEEKDGLFNMTLGEGLIEVPDKVEEEVNKKPASETKEPSKEGKTAGTGFTEYEDGTIELDEFLQKTVETQAKPLEGEGESGDGAHIEKTEKKQEKVKTPSDGDDSSDSSPSSSQYLAFARDRANEGVFLDFEEEDWKTLVERNGGDEAAALRELSEISVQTQIEQGIESYKQSLTEQDRALYEAKEKGVPIDAYGQAKTGYDKYSKINIEDLKENEKLQEEVVTKVLELRGFSKEEIKEEIDGYKTLENLAEKAAKALPILPKTFKKKMTDLEEGAKAAQEAEKDRIRQGVARMKQLVDNTPEIIPGIKLTKPAREKIMKSMIEPIARDAEGRPLNPVMATRNRNPELFEMMLHYYHDLGIFNINEDGVAKPDFSKIAKTATTEATDKLRSVFESKEKIVTGKTKVVKTDDDEIDDFERAFRRL
jgi:hypothetical protein